MVTDPGQDLIEALSTRQRELGLSDGKMAKRLHISGALWSLVKARKRRVGGRLLRGVIRQFPELTTEALLFLRGSVSVITPQSSASNVQAPQTAQDKQGEACDGSAA